MPLYDGIDLHANNSVIVLLNEQDEVIYRKRLSNDLPTIGPIKQKYQNRNGISDRPLNLQDLYQVWAS